MEFQCLCGNNYNKKDFKKHFRSCIIFLEKYKDFDFQISKLLSQYFKNKKNASIIKFLFERYLKLIDHKITSNQINKRKQSADLQIKNMKLENNQINLSNNTQNNNEKNMNIINNNKMNFRSFQIFKKTKPNIIDDCLKRKNCIIIKKKSNKDLIPKPNQNSNNNINLQKKFIFLQTSKAIFFEIKNNNKKLKQNLFQKNILNNNLNYISNTFSLTIGGIQKNYFQNKFNTLENITYNLISIGLKINPLQSELIIDICKDTYIQNNGRLNNQIVKNLANCFKEYFSSEWLIIIFNDEYKELYYNSCFDLDNKSIIFYLNNTKFHIILLY